MKCVILAFISFFSLLTSAQNTVVNPAIHSHNEYQQNAPFWMAYAAGARLIEADVLIEGELLVGTRRMKSV